MLDALARLREMVSKLPDATIAEVDAGIKHLRMVNGVPKPADHPFWPQRQALASTFFDCGPTMLSVLDRSSGLWVFNTAWTRVLGVPFVELQEKLNALLHPEDVENTEEAMRALETKDAIKHFENRYQHADGHYIRIRWEARNTKGVIYSSGVPLP